jgi:hypothetical protein
MKRTPRVSAPGIQRLRQIVEALSSAVHELHLAERDLKDSLPLASARLRAARELVAAARQELRAALYGPKA